MPELNLDVTEAGAIVTKAMLCVLRDRLNAFQTEQSQSTSDGVEAA